MASIVQICNMALGYLNHGIRIDDIDEDSNEADQCRLYYETSRDAVLRGFAWNFAMRYETLAELDDDPISPQWAVMYGYPSDCLAVRAILPEAVAGVSNKYEIANLSGTTRVIMCNVGDATCRYTMKVTDPTLFDAEFVRALAWHLASELSVILTGSVQTKQMAETQYRNVINAAWVSDGSEGLPDAAPDAEWIRAAYSSSLLEDRLKIAT